MSSTSATTTTAAEMSGQPSRRTSLAPLVLDIGLPLAAYIVARSAFGASMIVAFGASSAMSFAQLVVTAVRDRTVSAMSALVLGISLASIALGSVTGSVRLVAGKDAALSVVLGVAILVSVVRGRPLMADGLRPFITKADPAREATWIRLTSTSERFRHVVAMHSTVWGVAFLLDAAVRVVCAAFAPLAVLGWISTAATVGAVGIGIVIGGAVAVGPLEAMIKRASATTGSVAAPHASGELREPAIEIARFAGDDPLDRRSAPSLAQRAVVGHQEEDAAVIEGRDADDQQGGEQDTESHVSSHLRTVGVVAD